MAELVAASDYNNLGGVFMRYAAMATHLRGWSFQNTDIACIELPSVSRPEATTVLRRLVLRDFG